VGDFVVADLSQFLSEKRLALRLDSELELLEEWPLKILKNRKHLIITYKMLYMSINNYHWMMAAAVVEIFEHDVLQSDVVWEEIF
jgi:hypothetical protein